MLHVHINVQQGHITISQNHPQSLMNPLPICCEFHKWIKILRLTKKHQIKWSCHRRCKTFLSRNVYFQFTNLFKLHIYMKFVKRWTGRIVSLVILIDFMTFPWLVPDVITLFLSAVFSLVLLGSGILWILDEYFPLIGMAYTYIIIPSNQRQNGHII